jgi:hypothetical protein
LTPDPWDIPKKVWLAFTHGQAGASSTVHIDTDPPPAAWYLGNRYAFFIHLAVLENYRAVEGNLQEVIDNPASVQPVRHRFDWWYGLPDGAPQEARAPFPTRLPKPPRDTGARSERGDSSKRDPTARDLQWEKDLRERALLQQEQARERGQERDRGRAEQERLQRERSERERECEREGSAGAARGTTVTPQVFN